MCALAAAHGAAQTTAAAPAPRSIGSVLSWDVATAKARPLGCRPAHRTLCLLRRRRRPRRSLRNRNPADQRPWCRACARSPATDGQVTALALSPTARARGGNLARIRPRLESGSEQSRNARLHHPVRHLGDIMCRLQCVWAIARRGGNAVDLWDTRTWKRVRPATPAINRVTALAFGPSDELAVGDFAGQVQLFNSAGDRVTARTVAAGSVTAAAYSPDRSLLARAVQMAWSGFGVPAAIPQQPRRSPSCTPPLGHGHQLPSANSVLAIATDSGEVATWTSAPSVSCSLSAPTETLPRPSLHPGRARPRRAPIHPASAPGHAASPGTARWFA